MNTGNTIPFYFKHKIYFPLINGHNYYEQSIETRYLRKENCTQSQTRRPQNKTVLREEKCDIATFSNRLP